MKHIKLLVFVLGICVLGGCSNSNKPPIEYMNRESQLPLAQYDSVEYYKADKSIWNFPAKNQFTIILHFSQKNYAKIVNKVKQDTSYDTYTGEEEPQKAYSIYFKKNLLPPPSCSMDETMYRHDNYQENNDVIIIFCNRIYYRHVLKGAFD